MSILRELFHQRKVFLEGANNRLDAKLFETLRFVRPSYDDGDVKGVFARMGKQLCEDIASDVSW